MDRWKKQRLGKSFTLPGIPTQLNVVSLETINISSRLLLLLMLLHDKTQKSISHINIEKVSCINSLNDFLDCCGDVNSQAFGTTTAKLFLS